jgi:CRP-like cAMP-binding protein
MSLAPPPTVAHLREIGLFGGLGDDILETFIAHLARVELEAGADVFREGEAGRDLFVILRGEIEVLRRSRRGHQTRVALLGPGDWFGEMSILDVLPRSATMRVVTTVELLRFSAQDLDALYRRDVRAYSLLVLNVAREISRRLRVADGLLADLVGNMMDQFTRGP